MVHCMKKIIVLTALVGGLTPLAVPAQVGFGVGDEQQQFQQMQQLRGATTTSTTTTVSTAPTTSVAPGITTPSVTTVSTIAVPSSGNPGTPPGVDVFGSASGIAAANVPPSNVQTAFSPVTALSSPDQPPPIPPGEFNTVPQGYTAFIPYSGPPNRWEPLSPNEQALNEAAFASTVTTAFPMTTDQIHQLKQVYTASQEAAAAAPGIPPRPTVTTQIVSIAPGSTPPVIRLAQGFVSSLVFVDSTGAPWPIEAYDIGNPSAFNIQWNHTDNTLMIQSMTLYTYGNLAVRLKALPTPVMLTLIPGQRVIDYRVDLRIQGIGPNAKLSSGAENLPNVANPKLLEVLDGVPPRGAKTMSVSGGEAQAWLMGDKLFLRTRLTVLSPAWQSTMSSADGMNAYELQRTPMVLASFHGKPIQLRIGGF